jgi:hypothetical protein
LVNEQQGSIVIAAKWRSGLMIFWISVLGLYLELLLIRRVSTEI